MYDKIGKKICVLAKVIGVIGLLAVVVGLIWTIIHLSDLYTYHDVIGIPLGILGAGFVNFISSWIVYGFGQLVDDVHRIRCGGKSDKETLNNNEENTQ